MGVHARVTLRGVQVLVPEQLLDLAQVGARAEQLGGEDVAQRVGGDALAPVHARRGVRESVLAIGAVDRVTELAHVGTETP
jgi:hypothetical protein